MTRIRKDYYLILMRPKNDPFMLPTRCLFTDDKVLAEQVLDKLRKENPENKYKIETWTDLGR